MSVRTMELDLEDLAIEDSFSVASDKILSRSRDFQSVVRLLLTGKNYW